jgi:hypothetical protein
LTLLNEWIWSYITPNWARIDPNERTESLLSNSGGLKQRWHQNCSDKYSIISDLVSPDSATIMQKKKNDLVFLCSQTKDTQWVLIKGSQHSSQEQEVIYEFKTSQNLINTPLKIKKGLDRKEENKKQEKKRVISIRNIKVK